MIKPCTSPDEEGWLALREQLWPECSREQHLVEMSALCAQPERYAQFVAYSALGRAVGLMEVSLRTEYVNGTETSPVAFIEGLFVAQANRRQGIARKLVAVAQRWAAARGCRELASDTVIGNDAGYAMHHALGFEETERVVFFRKVVS